MSFYRRRLPHVDEPGKPAFITWTLHGSLPPNRSFPANSLTSGKAFVAMDRLLGGTRSGPLYLAQADIAEIVVDAIYYNAEVLGHYELHAFVVMPNHVHMPVTSGVPLPKLTKSLKATITWSGIGLSLSGSDATSNRIRFGLGLQPSLANSASRARPGVAWGPEGPPYLARAILT